MDNQTQLGEFEQIVLLAIMRLDDNAYGVSIRHEIHLCTGRDVAPGALYTTLDRMAQKALVRSREGKPTAERGGRAKRFYTVTKSGQTAITEAQRSFARLMKGLHLLKGEQHG